MKILLLLLFMSSFNLFAETIYITNGLEINNKEIKNLETDKIYKNKDTISQAEVLYGKYENIDLMLLISREYNGSGYLINYNRFRIDSYPVNNIKVYNSSYGNDDLNSNLYFLLNRNLLLNLNVKYNAELTGTMHNPYYNNQSKRDLIFSPTFKYSITEKSFIKTTFIYNDFYLNFESSNNEYYIGNTFFKINMEYSRIWSKINSFSINADVMQTETDINTIREINSLALIKFKDKFALSKFLIFTIGMDFNLNKRFDFIFDPKIKILYLMKGMNFSFAYIPTYLPLYYKNIIKNNDFIKINTFMRPYISREFLLNMNINFIKRIRYSLKLKYNRYINYPSMIYDTDNIFFLAGITVNNLQIINKIIYNLTKGIDITGIYTYIPYQDNERINWFCKNQLTANFNISVADADIKIGMKYYDIKNFLDNSNNAIRLGANIIMQFDIVYKINKSLGLKFEIENYNKNIYYKVPYYPEYEKLIKLGIYTGF